MRAELPPGYTVPPYRRLNDENIVVLAGAMTRNRAHSSLKLTHITAQLG